MICAGCLGSRSDDFNEIVECDGCGVTVHEGNVKDYVLYDYSKTFKFQQNFMFYTYVIILLKQFIK